MFASTTELEAGVDLVSLSPRDNGIVELIVRRPGADQREELDEAVLDLDLGLMGDSWCSRGDGERPDGPGCPDRQLTLMNARAISLIAGTRDRWSLAGDQFFIDLDLGRDNLPPGTRLSLGEAVVQITAEPHLGCRKFSERFGRDAAVFVNSELGKSMNLRGLNARILEPGKVRVGSVVRKLQE